MRAASDERLHARDLLGRASDDRGWVQVLGLKWILAIHFARRTRFGRRPVESDPALATRALEHDHDHPRPGRREAAPAYLAAIGRQRAARLRVPQGQSGAAALHRASGLQDYAANGVTRLVMDDVRAIDGPAERAVARVDRGAEAAFPMNALSPHPVGSRPQTRS